MRDFGLHPEGQFVGGHPGGERILVRMPLKILLVEPGEQIEVLPLHLGCHAWRRSEVENRRARGPQRCPLIVGRQIAVGPVGGPTLRIGRLGQDHEGREILVLAAQSIGHPRTDGGVAAKAVAGVHVVAGGRVIDRFGLHSLIDAQLVGDARQMLPVLAHLQARVPVAGELVRRFDVVAFAAGHRGGELVAPLKDLQMQLVELLLVIERVEMAGAPLHEQADAGPGF
jgi:hypothetical protein